VLTHHGRSAMVTLLLDTKWDVLIAAIRGQDAETVFVFPAQCVRDAVRHPLEAASATRFASGSDRRERSHPRRPPTRAATPRRG
jgi:hypothetical protein